MRDSTSALAKVYDYLSKGASTLDFSLCENLRNLWMNTPFFALTTKQITRTFPYYEISNKLLRIHDDTCWYETYVSPLPTRPGI